MPRDPRWKTPLKFYLNQIASKDGTKRFYPYPVAQWPGMTIDGFVGQSVLDNINGALRYADAIGSCWINRAGIIFPHMYDHCRSINPDCHLLEYANAGNWAGNIFESGTLSTSYLFRYPTTTTPPQGSNPTSGQYTETGAESWFNHTPTAVNINNRTTRSNESPPNWIYYKGSTGFRAFFVQMVMRALAAGAEGFWFDNMSMRTSTNPVLSKQINGTVQTCVNPATGVAYNFSAGGSEWAEELVLLNDEIRDAVEAQYGSPPLTAFTNKPILMQCNMGHYIHVKVGSWLGADTHGEVLGGVQSELPGYFTPNRSFVFTAGVGNQPLYPLQPGLETTAWNPATSIEHDTGRYWRFHLESMKDIVITRGLKFFSRVPPIKMDSVPTPVRWPTTSRGNSRITFAYGSHLLVGGHPDHPGLYVIFEGFEDWKGFEQDIGVAAEVNFVDNFKGITNLFARRFTKALVIVNPTSLTRTNVNPNIGTFKRFEDEHRWEEDPVPAQGNKWLGVNTWPSQSITIQPWSAEILVTDEIAVDNFAPVVAAGLDKVITLPDDDVVLSDATASDPDGDAITMTWSKVSGPGTVTFDDNTALHPTATFSAQGTYVLRLSVSDSLLISSDEVQVTVLPVASIQLYANHPRTLCRDTDRTDITARTNSTSSWKTLWDGEIKTRADELKLLTPANFALQWPPQLSMLLLAVYGWIEETIGDIPAGGYKEAAINFAMYIQALPSTDIPRRVQRLPLLTWALDFLYEDLTPTQRTTLANAIQALCDGMRLDDTEKVYGSTAREQALSFMGAVAAADVINMNTQLQRALDWWRGTPSAEGHLDFSRWEKANGGAALGSWGTYWYGLYPELLFCQVFDRGTDQTPFAAEPWINQIWQWLLSIHRGGTHNDHEAFDDTERQTAVLGQIQRFVLSVLIGRSTSPGGTQAREHLRWLFDSQATQAPLAIPEEKVFQILFYDPATIAAVAPKDATTPIPQLNNFVPQAVTYYRAAKRGTADSPWDYDNSVVFRISGRPRFILGGQHLDAGAVKIRYKGDPLLLSPAGFMSPTSSTHHDNALQRSWLQSLVPLIDDPTAIYTRAGIQVVNDGGQHFRIFGAVDHAPNLSALLNDGGGNAWRVVDSFWQLQPTDTHFHFFRCNLNSAYKREHTSAERITTGKLRYMIIFPTAANGLDWPALLYYARVVKADPAARVRIPFHSEGGYSLTAYGFFNQGSAGAGKLWVDIYDIGSYTRTVATAGTLDANGWGADQFRPPNATVIDASTNFLPSTAASARDLVTIKKQSVYISKTLPVMEEHYAFLLMPTGSADSEPVPGRTWISDADYYGVTLGTETFRIHKTLDLAVYGNSDSTPPGEVTDLVATPHDGSVSLSWTDPADADLSTIKVFKRTSAI